MTLTLDDVGTILGLLIVGKSVSVPDVTDHHGVTLLIYGLGITERATHEEVSSTGGNLVRLEWLRSQFAGVTDSDPEEAIQCAARAYLLFLLGCTLFSDKSGDRVPVVYLGLLMDLGSIHTYAWGAAALAFLYRQLGYASWSGVKQMGGYMTLLEAWIYDHFRAFQPHQNMGYNEDMPHVYHWPSRRETGSSIDHLKSFRAELDSLVATDVIWDPYHSCRDQHPCNPVTLYHGCLKCLDVVKPYHPDKVLRQFGRVQTIPDSPLAPSRGARGNISARYTVMYRYLDRIWEACDNNVLSKQRRSTPRIAHALQISHPIINAGYEEGIRHPYRLYQAIESMTHVLEGQHIDEAGPSSARPTYTGGRFPSSTLTYSRRPRRRHTADS
ncbi:protein MAIN-LIKE 1-like [Camellia sinensis]|uniref:protein MAIN-LIKE 1-like n=1 Tax=Camellia sinensis TaxID=4442 RepID=UPI00103595B4|nr:protein MAIN-LIKE 1-like [Camellia sinensis]